MNDNIGELIGRAIAKSIDGFRQATEENERLRLRVAELEDYIQQSTPETERVCIVCGATEDLTRRLEVGRLRHYGLAKRRAGVLFWYCPRHLPPAETGKE